MTVFHDLEEIDDFMFINGVEEKVVDEKDIGCNEALVYPPGITHQAGLSEVPDNLEHARIQNRVKPFTFMMSQGVCEITFT